MKIILTILKYLTAFFTVISPAFTGNSTTPYEAQYHNLGIPLKTYYAEGIPARTAWDVEIYDNKLFVASGDYDKNSGPVKMFHYDLDNRQWCDDGSVPDEQIEQFYVIDGKLMAPGCDPRDDWSYGNIYLFDNGQWTTLRNIPGGIHQFDIISFDNKLFAALGVIPGEYPIAVSDDGGNTFQQVTMYKDGIPLDTSVPTDRKVTEMQVRVLDFFTLDGNLYAFFFKIVNRDLDMEIYKYQDGVFHFYSDMPSSLRYPRICYQIISAKAEYENTVYFSTGKLHATRDMKSATEITLEENSIVTDLRVISGRLYVSTVSENEDGSYTTSVWVKKLFSENQFDKIFYFEFQSPAQSFTYHNGFFYFGMGDGTISESNPTNGSVLSVKHQVP